MEYLLLPAALQFGNPLGQPGSLGEIVTHSGPAVQMVLYLLFAASVISWAIIFYKFYQIYLARRGSQRFARVFWDTKSLSSVYTVSLEMNTSPVAQVFRAGYQELVRLTRAKRPNNPAEGSLDSTELGGIEKTNTYARLYLALLGQIPWDAVPTIPVEFLLLPRWLPFSSNGMAWPKATAKASVRPPWIWPSMIIGLMRVPQSSSA